MRLLREWDLSRSWNGVECHSNSIQGNWLKRVSSVSISAYFSAQMSRIALKKYNCSKVYNSVVEWAMTLHTFWKGLVTSLRTLTHLSVAIERINTNLVFQTGPLFSAKRISFPVGWAHAAVFTSTQVTSIKLCSQAMTKKQETLSSSIWRSQSTNSAKYTDRRWLTKFYILNVWQTLRDALNSWLSLAGIAKSNISLHRMSKKTNKLNNRCPSFTLSVSLASLRCTVSNFMRHISQLQIKTQDRVIDSNSTHSVLIWNTVSSTIQWPKRRRMELRFFCLCYANELMLFRRMV